MPTDYNLVLEKVKKFIQKYYVNELIKGFLIFLVIGLVYLLSILLLENFLWMSTTIRSILFWTFIVVSSYLFFRFIGIPLTKLAKIGKQISPVDASKIIGKHFPEIDDQLINLLQLKSSHVNSDLLEATIAQKSKLLSPIPFSKAISFNHSFSYGKYLIIPFLLFVVFGFFQGFDWYKKSLKRVVNYDVAYSAPAPFYFTVLNKELTALENEDFILSVTTTGKTLPNNIQITYNNQNYFLKKETFNTYSYTFKSIKKDITFKLFSGDIFSNQFKLNVNTAPSISKFQLSIVPPKYTLLKSKVINNSGSAMVAEGSQLIWNVVSENATKITFVSNDQNQDFSGVQPKYSFNKIAKNDIDYSITSSNNFAQDYENLDFNIRVIKDQFPLINVLSKKDTAAVAKTFYFGKLSDDYGVRKLNIVYYDVKNPTSKTAKEIKIDQGIATEFTYQFPNNLGLQEGASYAFYFEVFDNDSFNNYKSSKSQTFNYNVISKIEREQLESQSQQKQLDDFENTIEKFENTKLDLESFSKLQKQSLSVSFKQKEKLSTVLQKQLKQQEELKKLADKLKKSLDKVGEKNNPTKEELERAKKQLEQNKKLIEEIKKAVEKLSPKELKDKVDTLKKENKKVTKNLSQILELTKRYYVIDKHQAIVEMLELLSKKQIEASEKEADITTQEQINKEFQIVRKELDNLREHNSKLKKPMVLDDDSVYEGKIETKQKEATKNITNSKIESAKKKQNVAGVMMQNLADKMSKTSAGGGDQQLKDDEESLRQILDNLVLFSIDQETNMSNFSTISINSPNYSKYIRIQNKLKEHFNHIDDSLFSVASRNPKIGTKVNDLISDIDYNLDSSLESITDNKAYQGVTKLRFAISNANDLAVMLSKSLKQINQRMKPGKGKSKDQGFQLPDIIKKQESLNKAFQDALQAGQKKPGDSSKEGKGGEKKAGESGKDGKEGENGNKGESGKEGKSGKNGESGEQGQSGKKGKGGESGEAGQSGKNGQSGENGNFGLGNGSSGESGQNSNGPEVKGESSKGGKKGEKGNQGEGSGTNDGEKSSNKSNNKQRNKGKGNSKSNSPNGNSKGKKGSGNGGDGNGSGTSLDQEENDYEQLFKIYQQQQDLRNQLEDRLVKEGVNPTNQNRVLSIMKQVENDLIEKGFTQETLNRMLNLKHQLFKLDKAQFQQGKDKKRKSKNSSKSFISDQVITPEQIKKYFNSSEILNREALPLKSNYKIKVNNYFVK